MTDYQQGMLKAVELVERAVKMGLSYEVALGVVKETLEAV